MPFKEEAIKAAEETRADENHTVAYRNRKPNSWATDANEDYFWKGVDRGDWSQLPIYINDNGSRQGSEICSIDLHDHNAQPLSDGFVECTYFIREEIRKHAHLLAAAPDLLEALNNLVGNATLYIESYLAGSPELKSEAESFLREWIVAAESAIAKTKGE